MKFWQLMLLILATPFLLVFAEDKKLASIPSDVQIAYWRARALMMDDRLDLANVQMFGADGHRWNVVNAAKTKSEAEFSEIFNSVRAICAIDAEALTQGKVLKCK